MASLAEGPGLRYPGKVVIVTGGSKGIGRGCVKVFVKHGAKVVFCARGEKDALNLQSECNAHGPGEAHFVPCDVSKEEEIKNLVEETVRKYGQIDCLINNAGSHPPHKSIDEFSGDDFRQLFDLNVISYFLTAKYALPYLRKTKGNIINDSSLVAQIGQLKAVTYVSTKGAITAMSKALAIDEAKHNVRVNSISPGNIWTPMWASATALVTDPAMMMRSGEDAQLMGRFGTIEECGLACLYLAAEATFCTGIDLTISGGAELSYGNKNRKKDTSDIYN